LYIRTILTVVEPLVSVWLPIWEYPDPHTWAAVYGLAFGAVGAGAVDLDGEEEEVDGEVDPELVPDVDPGPVLEPEPEVDPDVEPELVPEPDPEVEPEPVPEPDPDVEPEPVPEPVPEPLPEPVAALAPDPELVPEPVPPDELEPELVPAPAPEPAVAAGVPGPAASGEPAPDGPAAGSFAASFFSADAPCSPFDLRFSPLAPGLPLPPAEPARATFFGPVPTQASSGIRTARTTAPTATASSLRRWAGPDGPGSGPAGPSSGPDGGGGDTDSAAAA
jgi:hypothetical protein